MSRAYFQEITDLQPRMQEAESLHSISKGNKTSVHQNSTKWLTVTAEARSQFNIDPLNCEMDEFKETKLTSLEHVPCVLIYTTQVCGGILFLF